MEFQAEPWLLRQEITVEGGGFGYAVIGADLHVHPDRGPVYVLANYQGVRPPDAARLRARPSLLLNAQYAIVDFVGRARELDELADWRDGRGRLSVRWLHGSGGQGKTRLANEFVQRSADDGWQVVTATRAHAAVAGSTAGQDLRARGACGLILLVDYADRWSMGHLAWLFSNTLVHRSERARVLLLARSNQTWPAIRGELTDLGADVAEQALASNVADRERMFVVARDCFAKHYGVVDPATVGLPSRLDHPDFGNTLTIHMAALAAVDAAARGERRPAGIADLSVYLLDRERKSWTALYENRFEGVDYATPPGTMARAVFVATLARPVSHPDGVRIVRHAGIASSECPAERILDDHAFCYPPANPATVLEPLYPDRLGEDLVALMTPGHGANYPADPWAIGAPHDIIVASRREGVQGPSGHDERSAVATLIETALRWPHVAQAALYPLFTRDPDWAIALSGPALVRLADVPDIDVDVFETVLERLDKGRVDVEPAIVDIARAALRYRLAVHRLGWAEDPVDRGRQYLAVGESLARLGRHREALLAGFEAVRIYRELADESPVEFEFELANALYELSIALAHVNRHDEALTAGTESADIHRRLAEGWDDEWAQPYLILSLEGLGNRLATLGRVAEALAVSEEIVNRQRRRVAAQARKCFPSPNAPSVPFTPERGDLARSVAFLGAKLAQAGRTADAIATTREAVEMLRPLAFDKVELAQTLSALGRLLVAAGGYTEAVACTTEAVELFRALGTPGKATASLQNDLAGTLMTLGTALVWQKRCKEALVATDEGVRLLRTLAEGDPRRFEPQLAAGLRQYAHVRGVALVWTAGRVRLGSACGAMREAVAIYARLAEGEPERFAQASEEARAFQQALAELNRRDDWPEPEIWR